MSLDNMEHSQVHATDYPSNEPSINIIFHRVSLVSYRVRDRA